MSLGALLTRLGRRKPPEPLKPPWAPNPEQSQDFICRVLNDRDFEAAAVKAGLSPDVAGFVNWGGWLPVMHLRTRKATNPGLWAHELRHVMEGHFHD